MPRYDHTSNDGIQSVDTIQAGGAILAQNYPNAKAYPARIDYPYPYQYINDNCHGGGANCDADTAILGTWTPWSASCGSRVQRDVCIRTGYDNTKKEACCSGEINTTRDCAPSWYLGNLDCDGTQAAENYCSVGKRISVDPTCNAIARRNNGIQWVQAAVGSYCGNQTNSGDTGYYDFCACTYPVASPAVPRPECFNSDCTNKSTVAFLTSQQVANSQNCGSYQACIQAIYLNNVCNGPSAPAECINFNNISFQQNCTNIINTNGTCAGGTGCAPGYTCETQGTQQNCVQVVNGPTAPPAVTCGGANDPPCAAGSTCNTSGNCVPLRCDPVTNPCPNGYTCVNGGCVKLTPIPGPTPTPDTSSKRWYERWQFWVIVIAVIIFLIIIGIAVSKSKSKTKSPGQTRTK